MRVFVVFLILWISLACSKEECYNCTQHIRIYSNKIIKGYPKEYKTKIVSCGDNTNVIDNPQPIIINDTVGDTIYTYWKDTDCEKRGLF